MANPLRWFRRHQKIMMVVFGVGLMAIFGLGGVVGLVNPGEIGRTRENPVIAKWKGGDIKRDDLLTMRGHHFATMRFLNGLQEYAAEQKGDNFRPMAQMIEPIASSGDFRPEEIDDNLIERYLLNKKAAEDGIVVSDGMVDDYLALIAGNEPISRDEMVAINKKVNQSASLESIYRRLKVELASRQVREMSFSGVQISPNPTEAMEYFAQTTQMAECEVLPITVDPSVITDEPSKSEISKIYEEGKYDYPDFASERPGFRIGKKVRVQYFVANQDTFITNEMAKFTDEDVQKEYDRLVETNDPMVMELVPVEPADLPADLPGDGTGPTIGGAEDGETGADSGAEDGEQPETNAPESSENAAGDGAAENSDTGAAGDGDESSNEEDGDQQSSIGLKSGAFVKIQDEKKKSGEDPPKQEESKTEADTTEKTESAETGSDESKQESAQTEQKESEEKSAEAKPAETASAEQKPVDAANAVGNQKPAGEVVGSAEKMADPQESVDGAPQMADDKQPERRAKPLTPELAETIRRSMARKPANDAMKEALRKSEAELGEYRYRYAKWEFADDNDDPTDDLEKPAPLDVNGIASRYGIEFAETALVDDLELEESAIGKILIPQTYMQQGVPRQTLAQLGRVIMANYHDATPYDPATASDFQSGSTYQYWIAEKQDSYVPEIAEAKDEIVKFWRKQRAVEAAMEKAKQIAEETAGVQLTKSAYSDQAVSTGKFAWLNTMMGQPSVSQPVGVEGVGDKFMETAFGLKPMETGYAPNESREKVYVIQMITSPESMDGVADKFLDEQLFRFKRVPQDVRNVAIRYARELNSDWSRSFTDSMGLEYVNQ